MSQLILDIEQQSDLDVLLPLLKRLGIKYIPIMAKKKLPKKEHQEAVKVIQAGVEDSYFNNVDALEWQREQRIDRELPYFEI